MTLDDVLVQLAVSGACHVNMSVPLAVKRDVANPVLRANTRAFVCVMLLSSHGFTQIYIRNNVHVYYDIFLSVSENKKNITMRLL